MDVKFTPSELKEMLANYYSKRDGIESKVVVHVESNYDRYGDEECYVEFTLVRKIKLLGKEKTVSDSLSHDDVKQAIKEIFINDGYTVCSVTFDSGLKYKWEGYGIGETRVSKPYFTGVSVKIKSKEKVKKLGE